MTTDGLRTFPLDAPHTGVWWGLFDPSGVLVREVPYVEVPAGTTTVTPGWRIRAGRGRFSVGVLFPDPGGSGNYYAAIHDVRDGQPAVTQLPGGGPTLGGVNPDLPAEALRPTVTEWAQACQTALDELGLTYEELEAQARASDYQSPGARAVWVMIGDDRTRPSVPPADRPPAEPVRPGRWVYESPVPVTTAAAALLRAAATGRREYAAKVTTDSLRRHLEHEAEVLALAAEVVDGNLRPLYGWLPARRWTNEMIAALTLPAARTIVDGASEELEQQL